MKAGRFYFITVIFLCILLGYLLYRIINPFLISILWAVVLTIIFFPLYSLFVKYTKREYLAGLLTIIIAVIFILGPFTYFGILLGAELVQLSKLLTEERLSAVKEAFHSLKIRALFDFIKDNLGITEEELTSEVMKTVNSLSREILTDITHSLTNILGIAINFIMMLFALFFFLLKGPVYLGRLLEYLPFSEYEKKRLICLTKDIIISTVYGGIIVALVQALIGGISFWILGIPTPVIWGSAIAIASFIPILGAFSVWGPIALYLFITGEILKGFIMVAIGGFIISTIDNVLKPAIIGSRTKMPTIVLFFTVLGGIKEFGLIGLIGGPLIAGLFVAVIEILRKMDQDLKVGGNSP